MATITFFHAHPDDEAIATGGTMASLADEGHRVVLVTATRGELGEIPDGLLGPGESLTERRMSELAEASRLLGVGRQTFLDYRDSGMAGEATNDEPGSFAAADVTEAAAALAAVLDDEASDVLVIYDEHGGYGHPDHVQVHRVGMRAAELAATPVVYMATMNRDFFRSFAALAESSDWELPEGTPDRMETMGEPASRLTTEVDVTPWIETKRQAMRVHASQIWETSFFLSMPDDVFSMVFGQEWYIRVKPEVNGSADGTRETGLMVGAGSVSEDGGAARLGGRAQP
ncbi:MAG TPA: PIG-L family deacetylase [Acidimicrobiales bacterium]|jgi:LmbE family N-acetylglucosaminyl deacetylase|nr:PIG-L family deacetylase [Acidimicrobiales bacterium]